MLDLRLSLDETNNRGTDRQNIRYTDGVGKSYCLTQDKNKSDDRTQRGIESRPQKAHDNVLQRERGKNYMKLFDYTRWLTFKPRVCDEIPSVYPATTRAR